MFRFWREGIRFWRQSFGVRHTFRVNGAYCFFDLPTSPESNEIYPRVMTQYHLYPKPPMHPPDPYSLLSILSLAESGICEQPSHSLYGPYRRLHTPRGCVCGDRARFSVRTALPARSGVTRAPSDVPASTTTAQIDSLSSSRHHLCPLTYSRIATYSLCHNPYTLMPIPLNPYSPIPPILLNPYSPNL